MSKKVFTCVSGCIVAAQTAAGALITMFVNPELADKIIIAVGTICTAVVTAMGYFVEDTKESENK